MFVHCDYCHPDPNVLCLLQHVSDGFHKPLYIFEKPKRKDGAEVAEAVQKVKTVSVKCFQSTITG